MLVLAVLVGAAVLSSLAVLQDIFASAISLQAKTLLGADAVLSSRTALTQEAQALAKRFGGEQRREVVFASMVFSPRTGASRLVQVNALEPGFPFYGSFKTTPEPAAASFAKEAGVLVDEAVFFQLELKLGDFIKLGAIELPVIGTIRAVPGELSLRTLVAPRVYVPLSKLEATGLIRLGSRASYKIYFKQADGAPTKLLTAELEREILEQGLRYQTAEDRAEHVQEASEKVLIFLRLIALVALFLGVLGSASSAVVFAKNKVTTASLLRCLGLSEKQTVLVFLLEAVAAALLGTLLGVLSGLGLGFMLFGFFEQEVPVQSTFSPAMFPLLSAASISFLTVFICTLPPLFSIRHVSPATALRSEYEREAASVKSSRTIWFFAAASLGSASLVYTAAPVTGALFFLVVFICLLALLALGKLLFWTLQQFSGQGNLAFFLRHGVLCLSRPGNRSLLILVTLGLACALLILPGVLEEGVLKQIRTASAERGPNLVLFDIQAEQREGLRAWMENRGLTILDDAPIISMKLRQVDGQSVSRLRREGTSETPEWALTREYRSTYRDVLFSGEEILSGTFPCVLADKSAAIPVSLEERLAKRLGVSLGKKLVFDVQGREISTQVCSIRKVDWVQMRPNFFVVFPSGVLEDAPRTYVLTTRVESAAERGLFQKSLVQSHPNVSVIDLTLVISTAQAALAQLERIVSLLTWSSALSACLVLLALVWSGRPERGREATLLKVLGAKRRTVLAIAAVEFSLLGSLAGLSGGVLACLLGSVLSWYFFEKLFVPDVIVIVISLMLGGILTLFVGMGTSLKVYSRASREVLARGGG